MWCPSLQLLSMIVSCLNIFASIGFTIVVMVSWCINYKNLSSAEFDVLEWVALLILLFLLLVWISFSVMLLMGIYQDRYCLIAPWIYLQFVGICIMVFVIIVDIIRPVVKEIIFTEVKFEFVLDSAITGAIALCLLPVFILYKSMPRRPQLLQSCS